MIRSVSRSARTRRVATGTFWVLVAALPVAFLGVFFVYPVVALVIRGFLTDGALDLSGFAEVLGDSRTWRVIGATLGQAAAGTLMAVVLGIPGAYVLYRRTFPGRRVIRALVAVPFVLPSVVVGVAFRSMLSSQGPLGFLGWDRSLWAILMALVFFNYGLVVRMVGTVWERLDPRTEYAASALGASSLRVLATITLPALMPAIASAASLVFLFCATAFAVVLVVGGSSFATIEVEIWLQTTQFLDLRAASVLSILQLVVVAVALWFSARARRQTERSLRLWETGHSTSPLRFGRRGMALDRVCAVITAFTVLAVMLPLGTMLVRSFRDEGTWTLQHYVNLATTGDRALTVSVWEALSNSLRVAFDATLIAVLVGGILSIVLSRRPRSVIGRRALEALDAFVMLPLGVSAVTVGFGFLIALDRPPLDLRTSLILIPIAQAMVAIPLVVRAVLPVLRSIDPKQRYAAAALGASPLRVLATIDLPLVLRSLGLAIGFAFAVSLGEFGATSFLARPDRPTLPVVIFRLFGRPGDGNAGMALAASVILAVIVGTVMVTAERLRPIQPGGL